MALAAIVPFARLFHLPECLFGCFVAGTPVQIADGTTKPIEQVQAGDRVMSRNPETGKDAAKTVTATVSRPAPALVTLSVWADWIARNPNADAHEIVDQSMNMMRQYGLDGLPLVPHPH